MLAKRLPDDAPDGFEFLQAANSAAGTAANDEPVLIPDCFIPANIGSKANPYRTYPIFYYGRSYVSDLHWIQQRLACLPEDKLLRHKVCVEYERLYLTAKDGDRRHQANSWLDALAKQYRRSSRWER